MRLGRHLSALAATAVALVAGVWMMVAPWVLRLSRPSSGWGAAALVDFWSGLGIVVVSGVAFALYGVTLGRALRRAGGRPAARPRTGPRHARTSSAPRRPPAAEGVPAPVRGAPPRRAPAPATSQADLDEMLLPIATALLSDLTRRGQPGSAAPRRESGE